MINDALTKRLRFCTTLPSLPAVAIKIIDLANDPDADIGTVCQYISLDPALAVKIIKTANSPLNKSRRTVNNVRQAVSVLGTYTVTVIALSFSLANSLMKQSNHSIFDSNSFWRRSIASALACRALGEKLGLKAPEDLFLTGLLQDIGILAFHTMIPDEYEPVFASASSHDALLDAERKAFGCGHDELGYALLKQWHIPEHIAMACLASHSQPAPPDIGLTIFGCVAVSSYVADYFLNPGHNATIRTATESARIWFDLDNDALKEVIDIMANELISVEELFEITIHHPAEISGILSQAKELLTLQTLTRMQDLEDKAQRDGLTGAHNRSYFDDYIQREFSLSVQNNIPLTIAMIDIDHFKKVNDNYGHLVGDAVLVAVIRAIFGQIRQDDILCRYGGEEFALILPGSTFASAEKLLSRIKNSIAEVKYKLDNKRFVTVTASIGVAANINGETHFEDVEDLIKAADTALYAAKHAGRNQIIEWNDSLSFRT